MPFSLFEDDDTSTTYCDFANRRGVQALLKAVQPGDHLIVWRLDRIERGFFQSIDAVGRFVAKGVLIHSIHEYGGMALDLTTAAGRGLLGVFAIGADMFKEALRANITRALQFRKANGMAAGPTPLFKRKVIEIRTDPSGKMRTFKRLEWDMHALAVVAEAAVRRGRKESWESIATDFWTRGIMDHRGQPWGFQPGSSTSACYCPWNRMSKWVRRFHELAFAGELPPPYDQPDVMLTIPFPPNSDFWKRTNGEVRKYERQPIPAPRLHSSRPAAKAFVIADENLRRAAQEWLDKNPQ